MIPGVNFFVPTTLLEVLVLATIALNFWQFWQDGLPWVRLKTQFDIFILLFLISACVATILSVDTVGGFGILRAYFIEPILLFYSLIYTGRRFGFWFIIYSLIGSAVWLSVLGVLQQITGSFSLAPNEILQGRISGVYNSANALALYVGPVALLSLSIFLRKRQRLQLPFLVLFGILALVIFWTKSRGGLVALSGSSLLLFLTFLSTKMKAISRIWLVLPVLFVLLAGLFYYQVYLTYNSMPTVLNQTTVPGDTLQIRYFIWLGTISLLKEHPVFGAGLNGFKILYGQKYHLPQYDEQFQYPHNLVLTLWSELGILGLFTFLLLIVNCFSLLFRKVLSSSEYILGVGTLAMLSFWMIHGLVDVPYFKNDLSIEFWIIVVLIQLLADRDKFKVGKYR